MERLTEREQFDAVFAHDWISTGRYFAVRAKPSGLPFARLGIVAGRKSIRRAVDRNNCKRMAREVFREHKGSLAEFDVVVLCRSAVLRHERPAARRELARLLMRISESRRRGAVAKGGNQ